MTSLVSNLVIGGRTPEEDSEGLRDGRTGTELGAVADHHLWALEGTKVVLDRL